MNAVFKVNKRKLMMYLWYHIENTKWDKIFQYKVRKQIIRQITLFFHLPPIIFQIIRFAVWKYRLYTFFFFLLLWYEITVYYIILWLFNSSYAKKHGERCLRTGHDHSPPVMFMSATSHLSHSLKYINILHTVDQSFHSTTACSFQDKVAHLKA